jgi:ubiquinone/menaquinone biosynthesis C-methylase UbiE
MREDDTRAVESALAGPGIHGEWEQQYRTPENEGFYDRYFDEILNLLDPPEGATILDAGCGIGAHSVRLAERGFNVEAVDFSDSIVESARHYVAGHELGARIRISRANLRALPHQDASFDYVLCWGVLMHVPDIDAAISELVRVLAPGGMLIVAEDNMRSLQSRTIRGLARMLHRPRDDRRTPGGIEHWRVSDSGTLMLREADIPWLVGAFEARGLRLVQRRAGQFTNVYARFSSQRLQRAVHKFNALWLRFRGSPGMAFGNVLVLQKPAHPGFR